MRERNFGVCHSCRSDTHYFSQCKTIRRCSECKHGFRKCFEVERDTVNKGKLFFTCSNDCGYFDWVKKENFNRESSTVNEVVNHEPNEKDEDFPSIFDSLARITEKRDVEISLHLTFRKGKGIAECDGKGKGST